MPKVNPSNFDTTFLKRYINTNSDDPRVKSVNILIDKVQKSKRPDQLLGALNNLSKELDIGNIDEKQFYTLQHKSMLYNDRTSLDLSPDWVGVSNLSNVKTELTTLIKEVKKSIQDVKTESDSR